jgi:hypothetical protein
MVVNSSFIVEEVTSIPTEIFNPLITDLHQLMQAVQYFGSALIVLYVIFMMLKYMEARRTRILMGNLDKDVKELKKSIRKLMKMR